MDAILEGGFKLKIPWGSFSGKTYLINCPPRSVHKSLPTHRSIVVLIADLSFGLRRYQEYKENTPMLVPDVSKFFF